MSTIHVKTNDHGIHVFNNATASEEDDNLVVVDATGSVVARFALQELRAWRTDDD